MFLLLSSKLQQLQFVPYMLHAQAHIFFRNNLYTFYMYEIQHFTYILTPRCGALLEQLTGLQLVKKLPIFHRTRKFITALTSVHHLSLSWASPVQSTCPHPIDWRSILILATHLCLGLPSDLLPSGFPTKTLYTPMKAYAEWIYNSTLS